MSTYLQKRGAVYYFRRPIPRDIRNFFRTRNGKQQDEWVWSLYTKDRTIAKSKIPIEAIKTDRLIADARAGVIEPAAKLATQQKYCHPSVHNDTYAMTEEQFELAKLAYRDLEEHDHLMETNPDYAARMEVLAQAARLRQMIKS